MNTLIEMPRAVRIGAAITSILGTLGIATASFVLSFQSLTDLVNQHSSFNAHSWMWAVALDGLIVVASIALVAMVSAQPKQRAWALTLLLTGVLLSTAGNVTHSLLNEHGVIGALIAAIPPLMLAAVTHLTVQLLRYALIPKTESVSGEAIIEEELIVEEVAASAQSDFNHEHVVSAVVEESEHALVVSAGAIEHNTASATIVEADVERALVVPLSAPLPTPLTTVSDNFKKPFESVSERASEKKPVEVRAEKKRTPVAKRAVPVSVENEEFVAWLAGQLKNEQPVTGKDIADAFGCSAATGRRWKAKAMEQLEEQRVLVAA